MTHAPNVDLQESLSQPEQAFSGDFYQQEMVSRSVSLAQFQEMHATGEVWFCEDFYRQEPKFSGQAWNKVMQSHIWTELHSKPHMICDNAPCVSLNCDFGETRFQASDKPPSAPADLFFEYEPTTVYIHHAEPHIIGNGLLDILKSEEDASILKVRREKYSIKANVFDDAEMCILKVRIYEEQEGVYAVEFQCRGKSRLVFGLVCQRLQIHLRSLCGLEVAMPIAAILEGPTLTCATDSHQDFLPSPILDMATCTETVHLQSEAATILAHLARDQKVAAKLCNANSVDAFRHLLCRTELDIIYPTVCALALIAHCSQAALQFMQTLLPELVNGAEEHKLPQLVKDKLSEVISICNSATSSY